ncbi:MAG: hypothetical protein KF810_02675 [Rhizobiaceae bacterium]|nr:hypothetical protein [Rhizobiaceae bacterium]
MLVSLLGASVAACTAAGAPPPVPASAAGQPFPTAPTVAGYTLTAEDIAAVKRDLAASMKDPESARFGETMMASPGGAGLINVCGTVNGKNSFGGYTGSKPFMGSLTTNNAGKRVFIPVGIGGTDSETFAVRTMCTKYGLSNAI